MTVCSWTSDSMDLVCSRELSSDASIESVDEGGDDLPRPRTILRK